MIIIYLKKAPKQTNASVTVTGRGGGGGGGGAREPSE